MSRKGAARHKAQASSGGGVSTASNNNNNGDDNSKSSSSTAALDSVSSKQASKSSRVSGHGEACAQPTLLGLTAPAVRTLASPTSARHLQTCVSVGLIAVSLWFAYSMRLFSVRIYGYLIHEFDPWFNFRAAQYMDEHGWSAFFRWFDTMSWYPIGRHVGATTYPGMQFTAVALHRVLDAVGVHMSFNNICVLIPAWFGVVATLLLGAMTYEVTASLVATAIAMFGFAISPAHTMRSMAGEFDNECIAMSAMLLTFYVWMRALRTPRSWPIGVLAGVAYGYMVATWGGFIFVLNMIALHASVCAAVDWLRNTYSAALLYAYSLFFVVGTALAVRVPPVGMAPFKSLEQIAAVLVFAALWTLHLSELLRRRRAGVPVRSMATLQLRMRVLSMMLVAVVAAALMLAPSNYFGPMTMRVRALFIHHTRTGNPLVDSVAEHQPASASAYMHFLHMFYLLWLVGTPVLLFTQARNTRAALFMLLYSCAAYYFSTRMSRLMLFAGPVACMCGGNVLRHLIDFVTDYIYWPPGSEHDNNNNSNSSNGRHSAAASNNNNNKKRDATMSHWSGSVVPESLYAWLRVSHLPRSKTVAVVLILLPLFLSVPVTQSYFAHATQMAIAMSNPRLIVHARNHQTGAVVTADDYLQSYLWLRNHTAPDARVLAWWDYGYQITGIGNRTTLADGNTWHHEHIATVGKMLVAPVADAHALIRHVADYVLIWAGQQADDLMKSHHMVRIANSVYHDICQGDPTCKNFGWYNNDARRPTPRMRESLLYNLHGDGIFPGVRVDPALFREVYRSTYGLVRIYKVMNVSEASRAWIADPANRVCRPPPHTWWCEGQFPPVPEIQAMLARRVNYGTKPTPEQLRWLDEFHATSPRRPPTRTTTSGKQDASRDAQSHKSNNVKKRTKAKTSTSSDEEQKRSG